MTRLAACLLVLAASAFGAQDPVQWTLTLDAKAAPPGGHVLGRFTGKIDSGWHLYSLTTPKGGPNPTTVAVAENPAVAGFKVYEPKPERKFDPNFQLDTETYGEEVVFLLDIELKKDAPAGPLELTAQTRYQCCTDKICLPPKRKTAAATINVDPGAQVAAISIPAGYTEFVKPVAAQAAAPASKTTPPPAQPQPSTDFSLFLLATFGAGLAAIFTPCVFPMIPFTVSYFINRQSGTKRDGIVQAVIFCLGIIVLFTALGAIVKAIAGPFGVVQLGNSPWVNTFIAIVFIIFGLSLLGAFELTLPSGLLTKLNQASEGGGVFGTLLMGLTFTLTSFACIGPIVGPLLVASVQTSGLQPILGMMSFATGLATPFFVLALFPSYLKRLPKSGGWLVRVKVVLGFIVLAISMKYLSTADQVLQKNLISRELFIASWVVFFALPGLYLLGFLRLEGINAEDQLGVGRTLLAAVFLIFSISLLPGMFGSSLGEIEAFIPVAAKTAAFGGNVAEAGGTVWMKNQYTEALAKARQENKLVFINFTGNACTNCHWMKANMFPRPEVSALLKDFVLVDLFTDGTDDVSERFQKMEESKFGTVAIPFYAILDPDEHVIATFPGLTRNSQEFVSFLKSGSNNKSQVAKAL
jgi:thiol:disulfide interchange protein DsbD